ncbi:hypothetical protein PIB30_056486 [Stylosanthes scabra]|uniref:Uncharacterized protein n=1 Tax=Stylosanthes scabra TaxID=79078 RepID=A0ABU6TLK7_9FABA|nr:hypothetical protein [Stylosanthes scabra]
MGHWKVAHHVAVARANWSPTKMLRLLRRCQERDYYVACGLGELVNWPSRPWQRRHDGQLSKVRLRPWRWRVGGRSSLGHFIHGSGEVECKLISLVGTTSW